MSQSAPSIQPIPDLNLQEPKYGRLPNGIEFYQQDSPGTRAVRLELIYPLGDIFQNKKGQAKGMFQMLTEGSKGRSADEIADQFDQLGAFLDLSTDKFSATVGIYCHADYFIQAVELLLDVIYHADFPEDEWKKMKAVSKSKLLLSLEKSNVLASRQFKKHIVGDGNVLGQVLEPEDYDELSLEDIRDFYEAQFLSSKPKVFLSGQGESRQLQEWINFLGQVSVFGKKEHQKEVSPDAYYKGRLLIDRQEGTQSSIVMGVPMPGIQHPDHHDLKIANTLFGGYFGSRLMQNIREEKGYTYGISSRIHYLQKAAYLGIQAEVKREFTEHTIKEILTEIHRLQNDACDQEELDSLKSYISGVFQSQLSHGFALMDIHKNRILQELPSSYFTDYFDALRRIDSDRLRHIFKEYYPSNEEEYLISVCGGWS
ncbi:MAG: insulinase family protein [Cyclobacteriaceae bacterium]|nr:insulinase family protein [Cyclobacteriaceae bacterium]MCH8515522.1 insulinase family protein [Cyclobacteriaceae bacterium]